MKKAHYVSGADYDDGGIAPATYLAAAWIPRRKVLGGLIHEYGWGLMTAIGRP